MMKMGKNMNMTRILEELIIPVAMVISGGKNLDHYHAGVDGRRGKNDKTSKSPRSFVLDALAYFSVH